MPLSITDAGEPPSLGFLLVWALVLLLGYVVLVQLRLHATPQRLHPHDDADGPERRAHHIYLAVCVVLVWPVMDLLHRFLCLVFLSMPMLQRRHFLPLTQTPSSIGCQLCAALVDVRAAIRQPSWAHLQWTPGLNEEEIVCGTVCAYVTTPPTTATPSFPATSSPQDVFAFRCVALWTTVAMCCMVLLLSRWMPAATNMVAHHRPPPPVEPAYPRRDDDDDVMMEDDYDDAWLNSPEALEEERRQQAEDAAAGPPVPNGAFSQGRSGLYVMLGSTLYGGLYAYVGGMPLLTAYIYPIAVLAIVCAAPMVH